MIEVENVHKSFGDNHVLKGISTQFEKGKTNLIIGQSGSGKTVFIKCLLGLFEPDEGNISLLGTDWNTNPSLLRKNIGLSLQETRFIDKLTVKETVRLFASFYSIGKDLNVHVENDEIK